MLMQMSARSRLARRGLCRTRVVLGQAGPTWARDSKKDDNPEGSSREEGEMPDNTQYEPGTGAKITKEKPWASPRARIEHRAKRNKYHLDFLEKAGKLRRRGEYTNELNEEEIYGSNNYMNLLQREVDERNGLGGRRLVTGHSEKSVEIDNMLFRQSVFLFPYQCYIWHVKSLAEVWPKSLAAFELYYPRPSLLIVGSEEVNKLLPTETMRYLKSLGVGWEVMNIENAASTYNILCEDGREACLAIIFPRDWFNPATAK
ncbi:hypothetical protein NDN08_008215 [Rhodosorus marinus]|uniref:NADH dehydrogenase [ubiquinone] 1 alpha subcomplex assembly factor 3 n=1 Tax=Rhodosorus marinus TaxID=101924 RepID=A0AAV8UZS8_9RHOD|nr:hypothetical protein NDN08_008215 [Rhodosorus marinus]